MPNLIMKDRNRNMRIFDEKREVKEVMKKYLTGFGIFVTVVIAFSFMSTAKAGDTEKQKAESCVPGNLISIEMASFIEKYNLEEIE
jgi:uncharacterized membrane protein